MKTRSPATRSLLTILAVFVIGGLAAVVLLGASQSGAGRSDVGVCQESLAVYEQALDGAERAFGRDSNADALAAARQEAYETYTDCLRLAAFSAAAREQMPPPTFARPPFTPPGHRGTPPPVALPRGTPRFTPPGPPLTPPVRMTPPGPPPTRGRPPFTPPGPPMTPPAHMLTPPAPPITPPGH